MYINAKDLMMGRPKMQKQLIIMITLLTFLMSGCGKNNAKSLEADATPKENSDSHIVFDGTINRGKINIEYPVLQNLDNEKQQKEWNDRILAQINERISNLSDKDSFEMEYTVTYEDEKFISIMLFGYEYYEGASYPHSFKYTYNISLDENKNVRLEEEYDTYKIANALLNGKGYTILGTSKEEFLDYLNSAFEDANELMEVLNQFDFNYEESKEMKPYGYSCYRNRSLEICFEVPHALGDCVVVSFPYEKAVKKPSFMELTTNKE